MHDYWPVRKGQCLADEVKLGLDYELQDRANSEVVQAASRLRCSASRLLGSDNDQRPKPPLSK
eukprot:15870506-Heterocapsa_arctica.AAC.1